MTLTNIISRHKGKRFRRRSWPVILSWSIVSDRFRQHDYGMTGTSTPANVSPSDITATDWEFLERTKSS